VTAIDPNAGSAAQMEKGGVYAMNDKQEAKNQAPISKADKFKQQANQ
jgi:hypothetical protein